MTTKIDRRVDDTVDALIKRAGSKPPHSVIPSVLARTLLQEIQAVQHSDGDLYAQTIERGLAALIAERCDAPSHRRPA